jgi:hypothetical protein
MEAGIVLLEMQLPPLSNIYSVQSTRQLQVLLLKAKDTIESLHAKLDASTDREQQMHAKMKELQVYVENMNNLWSRMQSEYDNVMVRVPALVKTLSAYETINDCGRFQATSRMHPTQDNMFSEGRHAPVASPHSLSGHLPHAYNDFLPRHADGTHGIRPSPHQMLSPSRSSFTSSEELRAKRPRPSTPHGAFPSNHEFQPPQPTINVNTYSCRDRASSDGGNCNCAYSAPAHMEHRQSQQDVSAHCSGAIGGSLGLHARYNHHQDMSGWQFTHGSPHHVKWTCVLKDANGTAQINLVAFPVRTLQDALHTSLLAGLMQYFRPLGNCPFILSCCRCATVLTFKKNAPGYHFRKPSATTRRALPDVF